jgi:hypothetical protein
VANALFLIQQQLGMAEGLSVAIAPATDAEILARAFWAVAPGTAGLLGLERVGGERRTLVDLDGANRVALRLQQPVRAA